MSFHGFILFPDLYIDVTEQITTNNLFHKGSQCGDMYKWYRVKKLWWFIYVVINKPFLDWPGLFRRKSDSSEDRTKTIKAVALPPIKRRQGDNDEYINPFNYMPVSMGIEIGKNITVMYDDHDINNSVIIVDNVTGNRLKIILNEKTER
jgi:hypothetical protein